MPADDIALMTAETLLGHYARQSISPVEALQAVTERVARLNPALNAFAVLHPAALVAAHESQARWRAGRPLGRLDGVLCTVTDDTDLAGLPTRHGSRLTEPMPASEDSPLVTALKAAGAVIFGKTTTTEFGAKYQGDSPLSGITRNPWSAHHSSGGACAGAAAAAAAGFAPLQVGTDAGGGIRVPAAWCGIVGMAPSMGRIPIWPPGRFAAFAVAGPITRNVRDAALLLSCLARHDVRDPLCLPDAPRDWIDTVEHGVAGLRVAVLRRPGFDAAVDWEGIAAIEQAAGILIAAGAELEEADPGLPDMRVIASQLRGGALAGLAQGEAAERHHMLDPGLLATAIAHVGLTAADLHAAEAHRLQAAHAMARFHQRFDLVLSPTVPGLAPLADRAAASPTPDAWPEQASWTCASSLAGQPAITVPMGFGAGGLPRSVQISAGRLREDLALRAARALELAQPFPMPDLG